MSEPKRTRLYAYGFEQEDDAQNAVGQLRDGVKEKRIAVEDWALIHKDQEGKVKTTTGNDPGAGKGGAVGGAAGLVLAAVSGPIGAGAILGGAAIGAVTAALKDSGLKDDDLKRVASLMNFGRSGILVAVPLDKAPTFEDFVKTESLADNADNTFMFDLVPGRTFDDAIQQYLEHEED